MQVISAERRMLYRKKSFCLKNNDQGLAQGLLGKRHSHEAWVSLYTKAIYNLISEFCAGAKVKCKSTWWDEDTG